jgi:hypothetical protein
MSDTATQALEPVKTVSDEQQASAVANQSMAHSLWGVEPPVVANEAIVNTPAPDANAPAVVEEPQLIDLDDYFKQNFGQDAASAKAEWEELRKNKDIPAATTEFKFENDESKRLFELIKEGKRDDVYQYLNQQKQIERLEGYDVNNAVQAAEIIKANLQFKYKDLSSQEIDRLFSRQYTMPEKPVQHEDQLDEEFKPILEAWQSQVQDKEQDLMIDAKLAKPELLSHKSQIVLPDIPKPANQPQAVATPEELAAAQVGRDAYVQAVSSNYQNFKGFKVTAKDGDAQLPIEYLISPEELTSSKQEIEDFNPNEFFDKRWFANGQPNINLIQEDLYLLKNRDKVFQKIANEAAAQRFAHHQKIQNNIKLNGVNNEIAPSQVQEKNLSQTLGEALWKQ